jgi:hypothetical protein
MSKSPHSAEWKLKVVEEYLSGQGTGASAPGKPSVKAPTGREGYGCRAVKKSEGIRRDVRLGRLRFELKYLTIQHFHKEKNWSIRWMCQQLKITKAAYYKWLHRTVPKALPIRMLSLCFIVTGGFNTPVKFSR